MFPPTPKFSIRNLALLILVVVLSLMLMRSWATEASNSARPISPPVLPLQKNVTVRAAQKGKPWLNLQDGHEPQLVSKDNPSAMSAAGTDALGDPTSLASADFNSDGFPDLLVGYAANGAGTLSLYRANPEAFAPTTLETQQAISELRYPSPFIAETVTFETSVAPDFISVGEFNGDGLQDVIIAARGRNALGLLAGDGRGNFKRLAALELPGAVTTMMADRGALWKSSSDVAVGIQSAQGPQLLIYSGAKGSWRAEPQVYNLPSEATGLAGGVIGNRQTPDIVAATGNQLMIVRRAAAEGRSSSIEGVALPFRAHAAQIGQFVWDREGLPEIALLSTDGAVHLMTQGELDRRPFTREEITLMRKNRPRHGADDNAKQRYQALRRSFIHRKDGSQQWMDAETLNVGAAPANEGSSSSQFLTAALSSGATEDLLVVDRFNNQVRAVLGVQNKIVADMEKGSMRTTVGERPDAVALDVESAPIAVLPMKLNLGTRNGVVIIREGATAPSIILAPSAVIGVTTNLDVLANDGLCSLREAIINANQANQSGSVNCAAGTVGSNQINLPAGTYTLTLSSGPYNGLGGNASKTFDDEFQLTNGFIERGGDLDIGNYDLTILGTGTPTIQAGTTKATDDNASGNGIDRVIDINNPLSNGENFGAPINVTLSGLIIRHGKAPKNFPNNNPLNSSYLEAGGGIQYDVDDQFGNPVAPIRTLTLTNTTVVDNLAAGLAGGILSNAGSSSAGALSITGGGVNNNISYHTKGGGMRYDGGAAAAPARTLSITNSTVNGNSTLYNPLTNFPSNASFGGGINAVGGSGISISGTTINGNNSDLLGAGLQLDNAPNVTVTGGAITNNIAKGDGGGVWSSARNIAANTPASILLNGVDISDNQALGTALNDPGNGAGNGGGIKNHFGNMTISNAAGTPHIDGNIAGGSGGGVYTTWSLNINDPAAGFVMGAGTIGQAGGGNGNTAKVNGGGFALDFVGSPPSLGTVSLTGTTITNNTANSDTAGGGEGGGIHVGNGTLNPLSGVTVDSNFANSGTGDGINQSGGTLTGAGTVNVNGGDSIRVAGGTFNSTPTTLNITGNLGISGGIYNASSGTTNLTGNFSLTGGTFNGNTAPFNIQGNFTFSGGTFNGNTGTFTFNGGAAQTIGGASSATFNNLTINNGNGVNLGNNETVGAALTLTNGALGVGTNTLTLNGAVSATGGSLTSAATGTVNYNQASGGQTVLAANYGNLTFSNQTKVLPNGGTVQIRGTFTTGAAGGHTITGSTVEYNGTALQTMPAGFTPYNNLTLNNAAGVNGNSGLNVQGLMRVQQGTFTIGASTFKDVQIDAAGTLAGVITTIMNVNGNWTNNGAFTANSNTVNFNNAAGGTQTVSGNTTFHNVTIAQSGAGATIAFGSTNTTVSGTLSRTSGTTMDPGTGTFTFTGGTGSIAGSSAKTFNNLVINGGATILNSTGGNLTVKANFTNNGTFTQAATLNTTFDNTNAVHNFAGGGATTFGSVIINGGTAIDAGSHNFSVQGANMTVTGTFTGNTGTVTFIGTIAQTIGGNGAKNFNNLTINNGVGGSVATTGSSPSVAGTLLLQSGSFTTASTFNNVQINSGTTLAGTNLTTMNVTGNWTNNGGAASSFTSNGNTVNFNGSAAQTLGGNTATVFNNLTIANPVSVTMTQNGTVNGLLTLTNDLTTGTNTLTMPALATSGPATNAADVLGNVKRTGFALTTPLSFGNPFNTIAINSGALPTDINVHLVKSSPVGFPGSVDRTYTITPNGAHGPVTLRLHYRDTELDGNTPETSLNLRRFNGVGWQPFVATQSSTLDPVDNWLQNDNVPTLSAWTFSIFSPTAADGTVTGRIIDAGGAPVEGAVVKLTGTQNRKFITDANGAYRFEQVETSGFYTVTPSRANYTFNPASRSFSQMGQTTDAAFDATVASSGLVNPLDTPEYFVRQNYLDFLGREPDEAGFNFWSNEILGCGGDAGCVDRKRTNVSAAYFLSIEFQETGGLVDGLYRASFARRPSYLEFKPDAAAVAPLLVVGSANWQATLENGKKAFLDAFVQRAAFRAAYDGMSNDDYVDALIANTGAAFTSDERNALVNGLAGGMTRAKVLRAIVEDADAVAVKRNEAFVLMEYFGYLRREPDAVGYTYWLDKLNHFNGNFEQAEMVRAFIISDEYRNRFPR